jgi:hypothetical protein
MWISAGNSAWLLDLQHVHTMCDSSEVYSHVDRLQEEAQMYISISVESAANRLYPQNGQSGIEILPKTIGHLLLPGDGQEIDSEISSVTIVYQTPLPRFSQEQLSLTNSGGLSQHCE